MNLLVHRLGYLECMVRLIVEFVIVPKDRSKVRCVLTPESDSIFFITTKLEACLQHGIMREKLVKKFFLTCPAMLMQISSYDCQSCPCRMPETC